MSKKKEYTSIYINCTNFSEIDYEDTIIDIKITKYIYNCIYLYIDLYDICNKDTIEIVFNNSYKCTNYNKVYYKHTGVIQLNYNKQSISHINNLLIKYFFIHKLLINRININYIYKNKNIENDYYDFTRTINDIKKINCMRLYKSLYYI